MAQYAKAMAQDLRGLQTQIFLLTDLSKMKDLEGPGSNFFLEGIISYTVVDNFSQSVGTSGGDGGTTSPDISKSRPTRWLRASIPWRVTSADCVPVLRSVDKNLNF